MKLKKWLKSKPYWFKAGLIGLIISLPFAIGGAIGLLKCNWNPAEGSVVPEGICKNKTLFIIFYGPLFLPHLVTIILFGRILDLIPYNPFTEIIFKFIFCILPPLLLLLLGFLIGAKIAIDKPKK